MTETMDIDLFYLHVALTQWKAPARIPTRDELRIMPVHWPLPAASATALRTRA